VARRGVGQVVVGLALAAVLPPGLAVAQMRPTLNFYGVPGLVDMPAATMQADGALSVTTTRFAGIGRTALTFQVTPEIAATLRYSTVRDWNDAFCPPDCAGINADDTLYDRALDLRLLLLREGTMLPALTLGLQDVTGTGLQSGEYLVATKTLTTNLRVSAGLGWGRYGSYGSIGAPFGARPAIDGPGDDGLDLHADQWFRGDVAPFAGVEWQFARNWGLKAEYSSDAYAEEADLRGTFDRRSPFNFGIEYQRGEMMRFGAYSLYGSEIGLSLQIMLNPAQRPTGGIGGTGPEPVKPRPVFADAPELYAETWVDQPGVNALITETLTSHLKRSNIKIEALALGPTTVQVRFRNLAYDAEAQAVGRVARAMSQTMPASVTTFEIVPVVNGIPAAKVTLRRTDVEALEFAPDGAAAIRARAAIGDAGAVPAGLTFNPDLYPKFSWALTPFARVRLFSGDVDFMADAGLRLSAKAEVMPGLVLSGAVTKIVGGNIRDTGPTPALGLPPVRSDLNQYDVEGDPALETLQAAWYGRLGPDLYGRLTVGYLERMFGGVSAEVLWHPEGRWAVGLETSYVMQRDTDLGLGFSDYDYAVTTTHLSTYLELGQGYHAQLDVGRYLAGDVGATLSLDRWFENGWKVGAFATLTDAGTGAIDQGVRVEVPISWITGKPSRRITPITLRSMGRNEGARLDVQGRLYETLAPSQAEGLDDQWGRFWK
jgi:hypothetical protein